MRALHESAARTDQGEVITDAATAAHGFGGFHQCDVDAGLAVDHVRDRIADRLHEAIDQRCLQIGAGGRIDAPARNEAATQRMKELGFPVRLVLFDCGQCLGHTLSYLVDRLLTALGVFFKQYIYADLLIRYCQHRVVEFHIFGLPGFARSGARGNDKARRKARHDLHQRRCVRRYVRR